VREALDAYSKLGVDAHIALQWCLSRQCIEKNGCIILGVSSAEQLIHNLKAFEAPSLPKHICDSIDSVYLRYKDPVNMI